MCVIALIEKDKYLNKKTFDAMWDSNRDGAGLMYVYENKVHIDKGYFDREKFWKKYLEVRKLNVDIALHMRISTSGTVDGAHCHGYPISKDIDDLYATHVECDMGLEHNGILSIDPDRENNLNDTQTYIRDVLYSFYKDDKNFLLDNDLREMVEDDIIGSRFCIMEKDNTVWLLGNGWSDYEGVWVSNTHFTWRLDNKYTSYYYDYNSKKSTKYNDFENQKSNKTYTSNVGTKYSLSGYDNFKYASGYYDDYDEYTWDDEENVYYSYDEYYTEKYLIDKMRNKNKREKDNRLWNDKYMERQVAKNSNRVFGRSWIDDVMDGCI